MIRKKSPQQKAQTLEKKGDQQSQQNNHRKAMKHYREAVDLHPEHAPLYQKLIDTQKLLEHEWEEGDLADTISWTMKLQELENPALRLNHARLTPEWNDTIALIKTLMIIPEGEEEDRLISKILDLGDKALPAALDFLLTFKKARKAAEAP